MDNKKVGENSTPLKTIETKNNSWSLFSYVKEKASGFVYKTVQDKAVELITTVVEEKVEEVKKEVEKEMIPGASYFKKKIKSATQPLVLSQAESWELYALQNTKKLLGLSSASKQRLKELKTKKALGKAGKKMEENLLNIDEALDQLAKVDMGRIPSILLNPIQKKITPSLGDWTQSIYLGMKKQTIGLTDEETLRATALHTKGQLNTLLSDLKEHPQDLEGHIEKISAIEGMGLLTIVGNSTSKAIKEKSYGLLNPMGTFKKVTSLWNSSKEEKTSEISSNNSHVYDPHELFSLLS